MVYTWCVWVRMCVGAYAWVRVHSIYAFVIVHMYVCEKSEKLEYLFF